MKYLLTKTIILFFLLFSTGQTNDDIKKLENDIKKAATDIAETLKIEIAIKGKKLEKFFINNDLILISENGSREYRFNEKNYEIIKNDTVIQNGSWKVHGLLKNQIRLISDNDKKKYYLKKISKKPWIYSYDKRPGSEGAEKEILHIQSSSKFADITSDVTFSSSNENSKKSSKKNEDMKEKKEKKVELNENKSLTKKDKNIKCKSNYRDNCIDILVDQNGTYEGEWVNNQRNGQGTQLFKNGDRYEGAWSNNKFHGKGTLTEKNGDYYTGEFKHNKEDGLGYFVWISGGKFSKYVGEWKNGKMHGHGKIHYRNGNVYVGNFNMGAFTDDQNLELSYFCKGMKCSKEEYERTQERENQKQSAYANLYSEFDNCPKIYDYLVTKMYTYSQNTAQYNLLKNLALKTKKMIKTSGGYDSNSVSWCQDYMIMAIEQTGGL